MPNQDIIHFISDLHLSPENPKIAASFYQYLKNQAPKAKKLYILGDLFDAWLGDELITISPFYEEVCEKIAEIKNTTEVFLIVGNRDFLLGKAFEEKACARLLDDEVTIELEFSGQPTKILLLHGDQLCTDDAAYQALRKTVRQPAWIQQILSQSLEARSQLAQTLRSESKAQNQQKKEFIMDVNKDATKAMAEKHHVHTMIHGHTHRPNCHQHTLSDKQTLTRWVLPDWSTKNNRFLSTTDAGLAWIDIPNQLPVTIRTRFAPSPTGYLHLGGTRTALYNWAFAKHYGGDFLLRIEDTDKERSTQSAADAIVDGMTWLGMTPPDEQTYFQSQRGHIYQKYIDELIEKGLAYHCYIGKDELDLMKKQQEQQGFKPRYNGTWRPEEGKVLPAIPAGVAPVVRFRNPQDGFVTWHDCVKGDISIANQELDDFVIARQDGSPTYNFCVVVDDYEMNITHVIRGDDHINNTPRQINLYKALGKSLPKFAHLSMILDKQGQKLSKRRHAVAITDYAKKYLPEALSNYLARLGWSHQDDEIFSLDDLVKWFDLTHLQSSGARFDIQKLDWINAQHLRKKNLQELAVLIGAQDHQHNQTFLKFIDLYRQRALHLSELKDAVPLFTNPPQINWESLKPFLDKKNQHTFQQLNQALQKLNNDEWSENKISTIIKALCQEQEIKLPQVAKPLRYALLGQENSPSIFSLLEVLGKDRVTNTLSKVWPERDDQTSTCPNA